MLNSTNTNTNKKKNTEKVYSSSDEHKRSKKDFKTKKGFKAIISDGIDTLNSSIPLIGSRFLHSLHHFVNVIMIAQLGKTAIGASALINSTTTTLFVLMWATFHAVSVIIARAYGAKKYTTVGKIFQGSIFLAITTGSIFAIIFWHLDKWLLFMHQPQDLIDIIRPYFHILCLGIIPSILCSCFNELAIGIGRSRLIIIWAILSTPISIFFGYSLLFGKFGFPELGIIGASVASVINYIGLLIGKLLYFGLSPQYKKLCLFKFNLKSKGIKKSVFLHYGIFYAKKIFQIGWPIGLQLSIVSASYTFLTYMTGWLGKTALSAHHIANQFVSLVIVIPYGIAQASGAIVAKEWGQKNPRLIGVGYAGILLAFVIIFLASLFYWICPQTLVSMYLNSHNITNAEIISLAITLTILMGIMQIPDAIGVVIAGSLRGFHDTTIPMFICTGMNWIISIPCGYILAFYAKQGAVGLYEGFIFGSIIGASVLWQRFKFLANRHS